MTDPSTLSPRWLDWAREIQALSQSGSHFAVNDYDRQRYNRLTEIAAEIVQEHSGLTARRPEGCCMQSKKATPPPRWMCAGRSSGMASC